MTSATILSFSPCRMADIALVRMVILAATFTGFEAATVDITGSTSSANASSTSIDLKCAYTLSTNEAVQKLKWTKSGSTILTWSITSPPAPEDPWVNNGNTTNPTGGTVTIRLPADKVSKANSGTYTCSVVTNVTTTSLNHIVQVNYKPVVELSPSGNQTPLEGDSITVTCSVDASPAATMSWTKEGTQITKSATLQLNNIQRINSGTYTCTATNTIGSSPKDTTITVKYLDPSNMTLSSSTVKENEKVSFFCSATSVPTANITIAGPKGGDTGIGSLNYTFTASCQHAGDYVCSAKNPDMTTSEKTRKKLRVLCKPRNDPTVQEETDFVKNRTEFAVFKATVIAYPIPTFEWTRKILDTGKTTGISNEAGHFEIKNDNNTSQLNVTILTGDDYAEYFLKAKNDEGETTLKYILRSHTTPYQVTTLAKANASTDSITVMWTSSFNGGAKQNYFLQYLPMAESQQDAWTQKTAPIPDRGRTEVVYAKISDIHPSRTYRVRIFSRNQFGQSDYSNVINATTTDLPSDLPFGVGIAIGLVISVLLAAAIVGVFLLYKQKIQPLRKGNTNERDYANRSYNQQSSGSSGGELYTPLGGEREKPRTYDDLHVQQEAVYQNVEKPQNGNAVEPSTPEPSTPEVYMNYAPRDTEPKRKFEQKKNNQKKKKHKAKSAHRADTYENSPVHEEVYANS